MYVYFQVINPLVVMSGHAHLLILFFCIFFMCQNSNCIIMQWDLCEKYIDSISYIIFFFILDYFLFDLIIKDYFSCGIYLCH